MPQTNIAELAALDERDLNQRAARLMGWYWQASAHNPHGHWCKPDGKWGDSMLMWCVSHDAVHRDLIPEIERRNKWADFVVTLADVIPNGHLINRSSPAYITFRLGLSATPRQLTIAAIATLEAANG